MKPFRLSTLAFDAGRPIPQRYVGNGEDLSPPFSWEHAPSGTRSFALICDDPDAPSPAPFVHWVLYNIPADANQLPEGIPARSILRQPAGALQGINSFRQVGYGGPAPPHGDPPHHYRFHLYALDTDLDVPPGLTKAGLLEAIAGHILAEHEVVGTYRR